MLQQSKIPFKANKWASVSPAFILKYYGKNANENVNNINIVYTSDVKTSSHYRYYCFVFLFFQLTNFHFRCFDSPEGKLITFLSKNVCTILKYFTSFCLKTRTKVKCTKPKYRKLRLFTKVSMFDITSRGAYSDVSISLINLKNCYSIAC